MKYQVGPIMCYEDSDPTFETLEEAHDKAIADSYDDSVHGIWQRGDGFGAELIALVYQQKCFDK